MFSDQARAKSQGFVNAIARAVHKTGVTPNMITIIGCSFMCFIGYLVSQGYLALAGFLIIIASGFDALDGAVARLTKQVTRFGGFLDSVTDRYAEFAIFLGELHYLITNVSKSFFRLFLNTMIGVVLWRDYRSGTNCFTRINDISIRIIFTLFFSRITLFFPPSTSLCLHFLAQSWFLTTVHEQKV